MSVLEIIARFYPELLSGLWVTVQMCLWVYPIGIIFGAVFGIARHRYRVFVGWPGSSLSLILSSIPFLVLLFWLHYPFQYLVGVVLDPFITSVFALSVLMTIFVSDIVASALNNFPKEMLHAAMVCGISRNVATRKIELPLIVRQVLPGILVSAMYILQATLFTSLIGVNEIFRMAQQINADIYRPVQIYTALAVFFVVVCSLLKLVARWIESRFAWTLSEL